MVSTCCKELRAFQNSLILQTSELLACYRGVWDVADCSAGLRLKALRWISPGVRTLGLGIVGLGFRVEG